MERIPTAVFIVSAVVFVGLGIWSATDENWSGVIVSALLAAASVWALSMRNRRAA